MHRQHQRRGVAAVTVAGGLVLAAALATPAVAEPVPSAGQAGAAFLTPYLTELDVTGDRQVTAADLDVVAAHLGATPASPGWADVAVADVDGDGTLTVADLAAVAQRMVYDDGPFELVEASVLDMQAAMNAGVTTSVALTQAYLDRIAAYDRTLVDTGAGGRPLSSVIAVSDVALAAAAAADAERAAHGMTSALLGVPVAVKDNYDTLDMPTTGGCGCWTDNQTATDATMVAGLRDAGAVILAKASLDEFAYGFVSEFSTGQPVGSTVRVASPYATSRSAGGSSGGTGAAIAANLAGIGFGTDTGGSIRVPSSYNQLVGVRPTVGLASRDGIIPLALSQDTGGPMTRSVLDAAVALDAVVGVDEADPATAAQTGRVPESYTAALDPEALDGARIGYVASMVGTNRTTVRLWAQARAALEARGATLVEIPSSPELTAVLNEPSGSTNEFRRDLAAYVERHLAPQVQARTIEDILATDHFVTSRRGVYEQRAAVTDEQYDAWAGPTGSHTVALATGRAYVTQLMDDLDLDAIAYPGGVPYGTQGTNMRLSPNTGLPAVTVPMGQATAEDATIPGAGVNLELVGRAFDEGTLLGLAYDFEQTTRARTTPALYGPLG
ncbi:dockerin type I domain-containing protein [Cellulomonas iranensis]|uniref:amidase family protein n=1 Tax=Cellulomonas iranensis TaxID=76862 RepID=UPI001CF0EB20|nr:amidase family protein [Cellulomonas iranensis]UCN15304.1 dockerin type I domain-containing protein [Cellulomonas iranensis]